MIRILASLPGATGVEPNGTGLPGFDVIRAMAGGFLTFALIACLVGFAASAATWAVASKTGSSHHAAAAKTGVLISLGGAFLVGAGPSLVDWVSAVGSRV